MPVKAVTSGGDLGTDPAVGQQLDGATKVAVRRIIESEHRKLHDLVHGGIRPVVSTSTNTPVSSVPRPADGKQSSSAIAEGSIFAARFERRRVSLEFLEASAMRGERVHASFPGRSARVSSSRRRHRRPQDGLANILAVRKRRRTDASATSAIVAAIPCSCRRPILLVGPAGYDL